LMEKQAGREIEREISRRNSGKSGRSSKYDDYRSTFALSWPIKTHKSRIRFLSYLCLTLNPSVFVLLADFFRCELDP